MRGFCAMFVSYLLGLWVNAALSSRVFFLPHFSKRNSISFLSYQYLVSFVGFGNYSS